MPEGKITKWFKSAGDVVKPGDNLFEIETDKTSMEVPSTTSGTLTEIPSGQKSARSALWLQDFRFGRFGNGAICGSAEGSSHGVTICASRFDGGIARSARSRAVPMDPFREVRTLERNMALRDLQAEPP